MTKHLTRFKSLLAVAVALLVAPRCSVCIARHGTESRDSRQVSSQIKPSSSPALESECSGPPTIRFYAQNQEIDRIELPRIRTMTNWNSTCSIETLVPIRESVTVKIDRKLDPARRYWPSVDA